MATTAPITVTPKVLDVIVRVDEVVYSPLEMDDSTLTPTHRAVMLALLETAANKTRKINVSDF